MNQNKKFMWAVVLLALLLTVAVSGTLAYLTDVTGEVKNTFTPSEVKCKVTEASEGGTKKDVKITNTGDTDAFIRAAIIVTWKKYENGVEYIYPEKPKSSDYTLTDGDSNWFTDDDGFYYWPNVVKPNESTESLIANVVLKSDASVPDGYTLNVEILCQAIQADGESFGSPTGTTGEHPVEIAWGVTYDPVNKTISN